jgi:hypothetical protein
MACRATMVTVLQHRIEATDAHLALDRHAMHVVAPAE